MFKISDLPKITFLMYSSTIKIENYDLQNVPTSTGRADVVIRVMKSALFCPKGYNPEIGLLLFPNHDLLETLAQSNGNKPIESRAFLISSESPYFQTVSYRDFSEHTLLQALYDSFLDLDNDSHKSLFHRQIPLDMYDCVKLIVKEKIAVFLLVENGKIIQNFDFLHEIPSEKICFILGDQIGYSDIDITLFPQDVKQISIGSTSYLGSSTVNLIKWMIWKSAW
jgi:tRNA pseudouridine-54 N-methylase